jgi:hypothetical protein
MLDPIGAVFSATFDLNTGILVTSTNTIYTSITRIDNGWYRCSVTYYATGVSVAPAISISPNGTLPFFGNASSGGYIYGAQLELGLYPTSYIPTTSGIVSRAVDNIQKTDTNVLESLSVGTFYVEAAAFKQNDDNSRVFSLRAAPDTFVSIQFQQGGKLRLNVNISGGIRYRYQEPGYTLTDFNKIAISWSSLGIFGYVNGAQIWSIPTPAYVPGNAPAILYFHRGGLNSSWAHSKIKKVLVFKTQLTQTECIALTS